MYKRVCVRARACACVCVYVCVCIQGFMSPVWCVYVCVKHMCHTHTHTTPNARTFILRVTVCGTSYISDLVLALKPAIQILVFERLKARINRRAGRPLDASLTLKEAFFVGALARSEPSYSYA
jgi:hypothetical protein